MIHEIIFGFFSPAPPPHSFHSLGTKYRCHACLKCLETGWTRFSGVVLTHPNRKGVGGRQPPVGPGGIAPGGGLRADPRGGGLRGAKSPEAKGVFSIFNFNFGTKKGIVNHPS
jgi:hypothetical protein